MSWTFLNPKVGTRFDLRAGLSAYASIGAAGREPGRSRHAVGRGQSDAALRPGRGRPERVVNVETGLDLTRPGLSASANVYLMEFRDEIAATGELSEIGLPLRRNVDRSFRRGLEVDLPWQARPPSRCATAPRSPSTASRRWTQFYDVYDAEGTWLDCTSLEHRDVPPLLSPGVLGDAVDWSTGPASWPRAAASGALRRSHAPRQHRRRRVHDAGLLPARRVSVARSRPVLPLRRRASPRLRLQVDNLLDDRRALPSGYSYRFLTRDADGTDARDGTPLLLPPGHARACSSCSTCRSDGHA